MPESLTINLPRQMPVVKRISEVSNRISEWLQTQDRQFKSDKERLQLAEYERNDEEYIYHYSITARKGLSASAAKARISGFDLNS